MKRTNLRLSTWLLVALFLTQPTMAQPTAEQQGDTLSVDLGQAVEIALAGSPSVQIAGKEVQKKVYARRETRANLLPNLSAGASFMHTLKKQKMNMDFGGGETITIEVGSDNQWSGGFNLALPVIAPALWKSMQLTKLDIELAAESARESRLTLVQGVKNAYYGLLMAQDSYEVIRASYANAELNAKIAEDKYAQGIVSEFDKLRADVQLKGLKPALIAAEKGVELATMNLKAMIGLEIDTPIRFVGKLSDFEGDMQIDIASLAADTSLAGNSTLAQLELQRRMLDKAWRIARAQNLPSMMLTGAYQWIALNNDFRIGHYGWFPYSTLGLTLQIPIYGGGTNRTKVMQGKIQLQQLELQQQDAVRKLTISVQNALNTIQRSLEEVDSNREGVKQAEKAYFISQKRYEIGSGNLLELNDSEVAMRNARLAYNQSIHDYLAARADLEATLGQEVTPEVTDVN